MLSIFENFYNLFGGMDEPKRRRLGDAADDLALAAPRDSESAYTVMSRLAAEHSLGRGILGFLDPEERGRLRINSELRREIQDFRGDTMQAPPVGVRAVGTDLISRLQMWRRSHPRARKIDIRGAISAELIVFLNTPDQNRRLWPIEVLHLHENAFDDTIWPALAGKGIQEFEYFHSGGTITVAGFQSLDAATFRRMRLYNVPITPAFLPKIAQIEELQIEGPRWEDEDDDRTTMSEANYSTLTRLRKLYLSRCKSRHLDSLPVSLVDLKLHYERVDDLRPLVNLLNLEIYHGRRDEDDEDEGERALRLPQSLVKVSLDSVKLEDATFDLPFCEELVLEECVYEDLTRAAFTRMPRLRRITMTEYTGGYTADLTAADFALLPSLQKVTFDEETTEHFGVIPNVENLEH